MSPRPFPPRPDEPLTPEERAWAERLRRVGPHDGPSPALDARILAAAHAAAATRPRAPRHRWPAYAGVAASLVVAVGLAWQLRPLWRSPPPLPENAGSVAAPIAQTGATLSADVLAAAEPIARESVASPPPPVPPAARPAASAQRQAKSRPTATATATAAAPAPAPPPPPPPSRSDFLDEAIVEDAPPTAANDAAVASRAARQAESQAAAEAASTSRVRDDARRERAAAASRSAFPAVQADGAAGISAPTAMPMPAPAASGNTGTAARKAITAAPQPWEDVDNGALDRIEVTGTRITVADLPVKDDARLEPAAWIDRIRERRDAGDVAGAWESRALFRTHHPRIRLPADLSTLER